MRLVLAACLLFIFATQLATDAVACPDECRSAHAQGGVDQCNATSACVFCGAGAVLFSADIVVTRFSLSLPVAEPKIITLPRSFANVPDRPPRLA